MGSITQIKVFNNRLSFWNAGKLPPELSIEKLFLLHESIQRNPLIAEVCYKAGYIDSWGRGVEKIMDACKKAELPPPEFQERSGGFVVTLNKTIVQNAGEKAQVTGQVTRQAIAQVTAQVTAQVGEFCGEARSAKDIMNMLNLKHWKTFQTNYLTPLLDADFIERTIPDKPTSRLQKYRLTEKGKQILENI
jgi:ATP-dependent DNA helicase RecG